MDTLDEHTAMKQTYLPRSLHPTSRPRNRIQLPNRTVTIQFGKIMESTGHVVSDINGSFESGAYHTRYAFLGVTCEFDGFVAGLRALWGVEDCGEDEGVVSYSQADGSYGAEDSGDCACYGIYRALVVEVCG